MAVNLLNFNESAINSLMTTRLDIEELKLNIDNMFLVMNGIIVSCEYFDV